ncbi:MAG: DNA repair protein RecO [Calditrichaeota bacterium]|nr:MAG: DNA repair protein RecO [Calditrichota bacterium]
MALEKHRAVVVRTIKYGETSKIVTLYSQNSGLIKLVAKGARTSKSRLSGILEPLNVVEVIFYHKVQRELHTLNQASIIFSPIRLRMDAEDALLALACCEIITRVQMLHDENAQVYHLLEAAISVLNSSKAETRRIYFLTFQLQLLRALGLDPGFSKCSHCASEGSTVWNYDFRHARIYCENCRDLGKKEELSNELRAALNYLLHVEINQIENPEKLVIYQKGIYLFLLQFYKFHLEEMLNLKSLAVLQKMKNMQKEWLRSETM